MKGLTVNFENIQFYGIHSEIDKILINEHILSFIENMGIY
jgi:hypothetical protein